jgi:ankyrin repeat protein
MYPNGFVFVIMPVTIPLHDALRSSNAQQFQDALKNPTVDVNAIDKKKTKTTPLMLAAYMGKPQEVHALLSDGAAPSLVDKNGETALHIAAFNNHPEVIVALLGHPEMDRNVVNVRGKTALMMAQEMEYEEIVDAFTSEHVPALVLSSKGRCLALIDAIQHKKIAKFQEFAANLTVDIVNMTDSRGWTPLMWACSCDERDMIRTLLAIDGIDIMKASPKRESAYSLTHKYAGVMRGLLEDTARERAFRPTPDGHTLTLDEHESLEQRLCYGVSRGCARDVEKILTIPGLKINQSDKTYRSLGGRASALSQAAYQGDADTVEKLLNYPGIHVNPRSRIGQTPLMGAMERLCRHGDYIRVIYLLVAHPKTSISIKDDFDDSAYSLAKKDGPELRKILNDAIAARRKN